MKKFKIHKVTAFFLAILMIFSVVPVMDLTVFAAEIDTSVYESYKGCTAKFNGYFPVPVSNEPENVSNPWGIDCEQLSDEETPDDFFMVILDYYYNAESGDLWYLVEAAQGYTAPEKLVSNPWVYQDNVKNTLGDSLYIFPKEEGNDKVFITDQNGNNVESITLPQYEKLEFTAESTLEGDIFYQWQIEYGPDKWVDIYGEDSATVKITYGMVASLLNANGTVNIRCRSTAGSKVTYSANIPVTVEMYTGSNEGIITESFVTSSGKTVSVTVSGDIPDGSALDVEETVFDDIQINASQTVTAAFDISVKNADGTEWQPGSGESVEVMLPADACGLSYGDQFVIYHQHGSEVEIFGPYTVDDENITFTVDGFSKFVFAIWEQTLTTDDLSGDIGMSAKINDIYGYVWLVSDPSSLTGYSGDWHVTANLHTDFEEDVEFIVTDAYVSSVAPYGVFYKVDVVSGTVLTDIFDNYAWVFQKYLDEPDDYNTLILSAPEPDVNVILDGNPVTEITISQTDKIYVKASNSDNTVFTYQWQSLIPSNDIWVDITGENNAELAVSYGLVSSLLDSNGQAIIRCKSGDAVSDPITVTVVSEVATYSARSLARTSSAYDVMPLEEGDGQTATTCNVIIQYLFENGNQAYSPWSATIIAGQTIQQTVKSPDVIGYAPDKTTVELNQTVNNSITFTVTYRPVDVTVTIQHLFQPVNGSNNFDDYIRIDGIEDEVIYRLTGSQIGGGQALSGDKLPAGFYALKYDETTVIAATGNTVIKIYYDRYFYLMNFNLDGGYGAEPIYACVGTPLNGLIKTPTKSGYIFEGWKAADGTVYPVANFPYNTMPATNTSFVAQWTAGNTTFDIVFWYENADDDGYTQVGTALDNVATAGQIVNGSTYKDTNFTGKDSNNFTYSHADENVTVKGDGSTVVNVYFSRNVYTMTFVMGSWADSCSVKIHQHDGACESLICTQNEHNHVSPGCQLGCDITIHTHSSTCCGLEEHKHTSACYRGSRLFCGKSEHEHGDGKCSCSQEIHSHNDNCYECGQVAHTHTDTCYENTCGKYEHYHSGNTCYLVVKAKYDADISNVWLSDPIKAVLENGDAFTWDITNAQVSFMEKMPGTDSTMTRYDYSGRGTYHWYYYLEVLPNQSTTGLTTKVHDGKTYFEYDDRILNSSKTLYLTYDDDYYPITGFEQLYGKTEGGWYYSQPSYRLDFVENKTSEEYEAFLYYTRESYTLTFSNYGSVVSGKGGTFLYQQDISNQNFVPDYPATLEPNAYIFEGWYESPFFGDTKFDFTDATMPAQDVTLYAHWVPKIHNVNIYLTDEMNPEHKVGDTQNILHRETATNPYPDENDPPKHPYSVNYQFVGWFYMDGDTEKAFDFSMPVTKDLNLYAKWSSNVLVYYTVYYKLAGTEEDIAAPTTGQALAGTGKTFIAKNGDELYEDYQMGYFPAAQSDFKMDMTVEGTNTYTFYYTKATEVQYTVKYLEFGTYNELSKPVTKSTTSAIVTENFVSIPEYMPDAYSKTAVVSADGNTVIIFYYTKDEVHAPVRVVHMTQNAVGDGYTIYQEYTDLNGVIDDEYTATILNIDGYDYKRATVAGEEATLSGSNVTGTVTLNGLEIIIYYDRELYNYKFLFLERGTEKELENSVTGSARYGATVTQAAKSIIGYDCVSDDFQTITIQIDENDTKNIKVFYYVEETVNIRYEIVGPNGAGSVTQQQEVQVPAKTGKVDGSDVSINPGYKFVGWFYDEACTKPVTASAWLSGNEIIPQKNDSGLYESATYYAKFDYDLTSLTIIKTGLNTADSNQTFIFNVSGGDVNVDVTVHGDGSVTINGLTVGQTYTITEDTSWSWRYECSSWKHGTDSGNGNVAVITIGLNGTITFTNERKNDQWLDGDSWCNNIFK